MKFTINKKYLIKPLQQINYPLSNKPIFPILNNLLLQVTKNKLIITSTNLEIEITITLYLNSIETIGATTVSAKKIFDICRSLSEDNNIDIFLKKEKMIIISGLSKFSLSTLPYSEFPNIKNWDIITTFKIPQNSLREVIRKTQFSMSYQDTRNYLNGMLFEIKNKELRTVTSDGHRLSICSIIVKNNLPLCKAIIPRKSIIELFKLLEPKDCLIIIDIGYNNIRIKINNYIFTSKLIDAEFPNYHLILSKKINQIIDVNRDNFKKSLNKVSILSNDQLRGVRLFFKKNILKLISSNQNNEKAEDIIDISYQGEEIEISFNINYLIDVVNILQCKIIRIFISDNKSNIKIEDYLDDNTKYIIMPLYL